MSPQHEPITALSLWQPWASMVAIGEKRVETRSWSTNYRGPLAIHSTLNMSYRSYALDDPFRSSFELYDIDPDQLPFGAIVGLVELLNVFPVEKVADKLSRKERSVGDYSNGRYAWMLDPIGYFPSAFPTSGNQRLWKWSPPLHFEDLREYAVFPLPT
jgi:hypothetical protein